MSGIMAAMKSFDSLGTAFSSNPAIKAIQQAQERKKVQSGGVASVAGTASALPVPAPATDTGALESRIAALESAGSNIAGSRDASAPSSMPPESLAAGEAMFGTQEARNRSIDPNIFNRR